MGKRKRRDNIMLQKLKSGKKVLPDWRVDRNFVKSNDYVRNLLYILNSGKDGKRLAEIQKYSRRMKREPSKAEIAMAVILESLDIEYEPQFVFQDPSNRERYYILDFLARGSAIEIDGPEHSGEEALAYDSKRSRALRKFGIKTVRYSNWQVLWNSEIVISDLIKRGFTK